MGHGISGKITAYPNEAIHDDCVAAFTGGYEKIVLKFKLKELMWIDSIPYKKNKL